MKPITPLNDFLAPFVQVLSDGQPYMRAQMLYAQALRLGMSEEEAKHLSGNQFTMVEFPAS